MSMNETKTNEKKCDTQKVRLIIKNKCPTVDNSEMISIYSTVDVEVPINSIDIGTELVGFELI